MAARLHLSVVVAFLALPSGVVAYRDCPPLTVGGMTIYDLGPSVAALYCKKDQMQPRIWSSGQHALLSYCSNSTWIYPKHECVPQEGSTACTIMDLEMLLPVGSNKTKELESGVWVVECVGDNAAWLSGEPLHFLDCVNGSYLPIIDECLTDCNPPQDCSELALMGFTEEGLYRISPGGGSINTILVWCYMDSNPGNSGWTVMMKLCSPLEDEHSYKYGTNYPPSSICENYFIGIEHLAALSQSENGTEQLLVFQFQLVDDYGDVYHATYDKIFINDSNYLLQSSGTYYGDAGDPFNLNSGTDYSADPESRIFLRQNSSFLVMSKVWETMADKTFETVLLRVRSQAYDEAVACPLLNVAHRWWSSVNVTVPLNRAVGDILLYTCFGENMMEGAEGMSRTSKGAVECRNENSIKVWNTTLTLPCTFTCPEAFVKSTNSSLCYGFSNESSVSGVVGASLSCRELHSATLAILVSSSDLSLVPNGQYYTAHTTRNQDLTLFPTLPQDLICDQDCQGTQLQQCLVAEPERVHMEDCNLESITYMCSLPATCPPDFSPHRGLCYKVITEQTLNFTEGLNSCRASGAVLAYPETMETIGFLKEITESAMINISLEAVGAMLGLNDVTGDWTAGGLYTPDQSVTDVAGLSPKGLHWRQLFIKLGESPELIPVPLDSANHSIIICQFIGPYNCWTEPPVPSVNMIREWDLSQHYLAQAVYHCLPGHFVNSSTRSSEIIVSCLAQLGGWYPVALPLCLPYDVCLGDVPLPPSPQFTNVTDSNFRHLNGSVHFFCPDGMVTHDGASLQIVTCTFEMEQFVFMPNVVQDCYAVCSEEPVVANATTDWVTATWIVGDVVNATCLPGYHVTPGTDTQLVNCTADGWQSTPCYQACVDPPPPGVNMIMEVITKNAVGAVLNYTCETGFWIPTDQMNPVVTNVSSVVCSSEQTWVPTTSLECIKMCSENPIQLPELASSTWDNFTRTVGTVVEVSCAENMLFANLSQTLRVTCREDGTWTNLDASILMCKAGTYLPPSVPLDQNTSAILEGPHPPYFEGSSMNYSCQPGTISLTGVSFIALYFTAAGWSEVDPGFECVPGTMDSPPVSLANAATLVGPGPPYKEGATLNYTCKPGLFISTGDTYITITYTAGNWIPSPHLACHSGNWRHFG